MTWTIPPDGVLPDNINTMLGKHWASRSRAKRALTDHIGIVARQQRIPAAIGRRSVVVTIHKSKRSRILDDQDNLMSRAKYVLDALTHLGLIVNDDAKHLASIDVIEGERRATKATVIEISEAGAAA